MENGFSKNMEKWNYEEEDEKYLALYDSTYRHIEREKSGGYNNNGTSKPLAPGESTSDVVAACEIIREKFYFATLRCKPKSTSRTHYFTVDEELRYENFYSDFGPLNLSHIYRYCQKVKQKLDSKTLGSKKIVHYTSENQNNRVNAAFLAGCYQIIYLNKKAEDVYKLLVCCNRQQQTLYKNDASFHNIHLTHKSSRAKEVCDQRHQVYKPYRDAALGSPLYLVTLLDCLLAVERALKHKWLNFDTFEVDEYEFYERVENGDLNWLIPDKFIAFCGPHNKSKVEDGYPLHAPESYFGIFRKYTVKDVIRLNKKMYNAKRFTDGNFEHHDLYFIDGSNPPESILQKFLKISESRLRPEDDDFSNFESPKNGVLAVHCKAGLGRTGTLIAAYIMKHYKWPASEIIAWLRICRPGSVIGPQQIYLVNRQEDLFRAGDDYHRRFNTDRSSLEKSPSIILSNSSRDNLVNAASHSKQSQNNIINGNAAPTTHNSATNSSQQHHHTGDRGQLSYQTVAAGAGHSGVNGDRSRGNGDQNFNINTNQTNANHNNHHSQTQNDKLYQQVMKEQTAVSSKGMTQGDRLRAVKTMGQKNTGSLGAGSKGRTSSTNRISSSNNNKALNNGLEERSKSGYADGRGSGISKEFPNTEDHSLHSPGVITRSRSKVEVSKKVVNNSHEVAQNSINLQNSSSTRPHAVTHSSKTAHSAALRRAHQISAVNTGSQHSSDTYNSSQITHNAASSSLQNSYANVNVNASTNATATLNINASHSQISAQNQPKTAVSNFNSAVRPNSAHPSHVYAYREGRTTRDQQSKDNTTTRDINLSQYNNGSRPKSSHPDVGAGTAGHYSTRNGGYRGLPGEKANTKRK